MKRLLFLLLFLPIFSFAQFTYQFDQSIPVTVSGKLLEMPWAGGINAAQYNTIDLNADGQSDLVIFDRSSNKVITYLVIDQKYVYSPEYEVLFPKEINNWLIIKDYNCDGKKDIFTSSPFGITTYVNTGQTLPEWTVDANIVTAEGTNGIINLKINGDDVPAIIDLDNDGDLDILTFGFTGSGQIQYYQNLSMENIGLCNVESYKRTTRRWGDFDVCDCGIFIYGINECPNGGRVEHAGGKSLLAFDVDGDGDHDLVIGEENCNQLYLVENIGNNSIPVLRNATEFPENNPVSLHHFPAAYLEDVTFDGVPDLLVSSNYPFNAFNSIDFSNSSWVYKNTSTEQIPTFQFQQNDFLQNNMLEFGENAVPAFIDVDGDGDLDMLITSRGTFTTSGSYQSKLFLFENKGSSSNPIFELVNENYLELGDLNFSQGRLQFADLNNDNTQDLIFSGVPNGGFTSIVTFTYNNSAHKLDFSGQQIDVLPVNLFFYETPYFYDINNDGFADLLLGNSNGSLAYYRNNGNLQFDLVDDSFYDIGSSFTNRSIIPTIADLNNDQRVELITTDGTGELTIYDEFLHHLSSPLEGMKENLFNPLFSELLTARLGSWNLPIVADLYSSGTPLIFLGTVQGGIRILKNTEANYPGSVDHNKSLIVYPNPGSPLLNSGKVFIKASKSIEVRIVSVLGKEVFPLTPLDSDGSLTIQVQYLQAGLYIALAYEVGILIETQRFVVVK